MAYLFGGLEWTGFVQGTALILFWIALLIALTANAFEDDRLECLEAGMDDHLSKPLQKEKLELALVRTSRISPAE